MLADQVVGKLFDRGVLEEERRGQRQSGFGGERFLNLQGQDRVKAQVHEIGRRIELASPQSQQLIELPTDQIGDRRA